MPIKLERMDKFNFNKFFRELKSEYAYKAISYFQLALSKKLIEFSTFWGIAGKEINCQKFLSAYFKSKASSPEVVLFFIENDPASLKTVIKETKAYARDAHFESILAAFKDDKQFLKEIKFWKNLFQELDLNIKKCEAFLSEYSIEELIVLLGFYYEKERISKLVERNQDYQLIETMNEILTRKLYAIKEPGKTITATYSSDELYLFGIKLLGELILKGDEGIQKTFNVFRDYVEIQNVYDKYCIQEFELSFFDDKTVNVKPTNEKSYLKYRNDGKKYQYWQNYYYNTLAFEHGDIVEDIDSSERSWYNKIGEKNTWANLYQFIDAGFNYDIQIDNSTTITSFDFFRTINSLAGWSNIRWNNLIEMRLQRQGLANPYKNIMEIMMQNEEEYNNSVLPVLFREFDLLIKQADEITRSEKGTARHSISLFTNKLSDDRTTRINISEKPFIKIGQNVFWVAGILSNKNYSIMLQNLLLQEDRKKGKGGPTQLYSKNAEENLVFWFNKSGFDTLANHTFISGNGEIDLLALKDGMLFIGEIKSTFYRSTVREIHLHLNNEEFGIRKAIGQLEKDIVYLESNWNEIKNLLKTKLNFSDIKVVPLAISSTLEEGQGKMLIGGLEGFIVSSFDLTLILTNRKFYLLNLFEVALSLHFPDGIPTKYMEVMMGLKNDLQVISELNSILNKFIMDSASQLDFNLWTKDNKFCSAKDLYAALNERKLWDFISKDKSLTMKNIFVGDYTLNYFE
jgi:hypothetical protein